MPRVIVPLNEDEYEALLLVSEAERRDPRDQVALWARRQLENGGLLAPLILQHAAGATPAHSEVQG